MASFSFLDVAEVRTDIPNRTKRTYPSNKAIRTFWADWLASSESSDDDPKFICAGEVFTEGDVCFACGTECSLERAHILARCEGGSDEVSNFHLLCGRCHRQSEFIHGAEYLEWFRAKKSPIREMLTAVAQIRREITSEVCNDLVIDGLVSVEDLQRVYSYYEPSERVEKVLANA